MKSKLLLSASFAALAVSFSAGGAYATPPNPNNSPIPFAEINTTVTGDFTNNSIIGALGAFAPETGLYIDGGSVSGDIVNNGYIRASETGVKVNDGDGTLSGAIVNSAGGHITASTASGDHARGIYEGGEYISHQDVQNSGDIIAKAANDWGDAFGETQWVQATGISQYIDDEGNPATNNVDNTGMIVASASSYMNGGDINSYAGATGVEQENSYAATATNTLTNGKAALISANAVAHATAYGIGEEANASAYASGVYQSVEYVDQGSNLLTNDGSINVSAKALAHQVEGDGDTASASAQAIGVNQYAYDGSQLTDSVKNTGLILVAASAYASGTFAKVGTDNFIDDNVGGYQVYLPSDVAIGVYQQVYDAYTGLATLDNSGWIDAEAGAYGNGYAIDLNAAAVGVLQYVTDVDYGTAYVHNAVGGYISAQATASGYAFESAHAQATAKGVFQIVQATEDGYATVVNDGQINAFASASAWTFDGSLPKANASALAIGVDQLVVSEGIASAFAHVQNSGEIYATATAQARGETDNFGTRAASAVAIGVEQIVQDSFHVSATVVNEGLIYAEADAYAGYNYSGGIDPFGKNSASAVAIGVEQIASLTQVGDHDAVLSVNNGTDGYISAFADAAAAFATTEGSGTAQAHALAIGIEQQFFGDPETGYQASVVNDGYIRAFATANVVDPESGLPETNFLMGSASATAAGIYQHRGDEGGGTQFDFSVDNSGGIFAAAEAYASSAHAYAAGIMAGDYHYLDATGSQENVSINLKQTNEESGYITAQAVAGGVDAVAVAVGIGDRAGTLGGTVENLGHIYASAFASAAVSEGYVRAVGIDADANTYDDLKIENKGTIVAYVNANPGDLFFDATGILLEPYDVAGLPGGGSVNITNDGGTIFAGIGLGTDTPDAGSIPVMTSDNGKYFNSDYENYFNRSHVVRGNAINVAGLTSDQSVVIDLKGTDRTGNIYGNILLGSFESGNVPSIVVSDGLTRFNGIVEPAEGYSPDGYNGTGTLDIKEGGTFKLVLNQDPETPIDYRFTGLTDLEQPRVYVDTLNVEEGGTLSIGLSTDNEIGHYGQVFAENLANGTGPIAGDLKVHFIPGHYQTNGSWWYDSLVNSPALDTARFNDVYSNTPLIEVTSVDYTGGNVDVEVGRVSFEDAADTTNRKSVGAAIDSFYGDLGDPTFEQSSGGQNYLDGADLLSFDDLIASIFALDGTQAFEDMMDKLSAEPYAQQLNQALTSMDGLQNLLLDRVANGGGGGNSALGYDDEKTAANSPASKALVTASLPPQPKMEFWARGFGDWQSQNDPSTALAYSGSQAGGYLGGDILASPNLILGFAGGATGSSMNFDNGDHISSSGFQVAGYGRWDSNAWYVRGFGGVGDYTNKSTRIVPIMMTPTEMNGEYGTKVAGGYAELGFKGFENASGGIIPFAGLSAAWASNDAFTETGGSAQLDVAAADAMRVSSSVGAELVWRTTLGSMPFEALGRAAWVHVWTGGAASVDASFIEAPDANGFTSTSTLAGDMAALTASGTWKVAPMTSVTAQYDGKFGSGFVETTVSGVLKQQF